MSTPVPEPHAIQAQSPEVQRPLDSKLSRTVSNASSASSSSSSSVSTAEDRANDNDGDLEAQQPKRSFRRRLGSAATGRSIASMASARTERDIYGDATAEQRTLSRIETIQTLKSIYTRATENAPELDQPNDASAFKDIDPELVTWDGPDDPENPRNWPAGKKWRTTGIVSLYTFVTPFASSIIAPAVPYIAREFKITNATVASLIVSIFVLGFAFGPLVLAPLSEMYGRTIVMHIAMGIFFVFNIAGAVSKSTGELIGFRFLAGLSGSAPLALGAGCLADLWTPMELAKAMALYSLGPLLGPVTAPIIAGFIVQNVHWAWVMWLLSIVSGVTSVLGIWLFRTECYAPTILNRRAAKLRKVTGNEHLHTIFELNRDFKRTFILALERPFKLLIFNQALLSLGLFMAFTYGFLYLLFTTFPVLYGPAGVYGFSAGISGLMYLGPGIGFMIGLGIFTPLGQKIYIKLTAANDGESQPEYRLPVIFFGGLLIPVGLFWYGWSAEKKLHWIMPEIGVAFFGCGLISVFAAVQSYVIDMSPQYAASAVSAATVFRSLFGFIFPLFGRQMYDALGYGWGNTMLGIIALVIGVPFPLLIFRYGPKLRAAAVRRMENSEKSKVDRQAATDTITPTLLEPVVTQASSEKM